MIDPNVMKTLTRFGIDPSTQIHDQAKRPYSLATDEPLVKLFSN